MNFFFFCFSIFIALYLGLVGGRKNIQRKTTSPFLSQLLIHYMSTIQIFMHLIRLCVKNSHPFASQSFLQHFAPFEVHINIKTLLNTPPYQKYTFSERKLHEESKYDIQKCVGGRVRMSGLRKSTILDQIWNSPSCVISPYPEPLLPISSDLNSL